MRGTTATCTSSPAGDGSPRVAWTDTHRGHSRIIPAQILCDGGERHLSKFWSEIYLEKAGVLPPVRTPPPPVTGGGAKWLLFSPPLSRIRQRGRCVTLLAGKSLPRAPPVVAQEWKANAEAGGIGGSPLRGTEAAAFYLRDLLSGPPQGSDEAQQPLRRGAAVGGYGSSGSVAGGAAGSSSAASLASASGGGEADGGKR